MAEIGYALAAFDTPVTRSESSYGDFSSHTANQHYIPAADIAASTAYWVIAMCSREGDNAAASFSLKLQEAGGSDLDESESTFTPQGTSVNGNNRQHYGYIGEYISPATPLDVEWQGVCGDAADEMAISDGFILLLPQAELTAIDSDSADYGEDDDVASPVDLTTSWVGFGSATVVGADASDKLLAIAAVKFAVNNTGTPDMMFRIDVDGSAQWGAWRVSGLGTSDEYWLMNFYPIASLGAGDHTFTLQAQSNSATGTQHAHLNSRVLVLNLSKLFAQSAVVVDAAGSGVASAFGWEDGDVSATLTPDATGDFIAFSGAQYDSDAGEQQARYGIELDDSGSEEDVEGGNRSSNSADDMPVVAATVQTSLDTSSHKWQSRLWSGSTSVTFEWQSMVVFSAELGTGEGGGGGGSAIVAAIRMYDSLAGGFPL